MKQGMAIQTRPWDAAEYLSCAESIAGYLEAMLEENNESDLIALAFDNIARAIRMHRLADGRASMAIKTLPRM